MISNNYDDIKSISNAFNNAYFQPGQKEQLLLGMLAVDILRGEWALPHKRRNEHCLIIINKALKILNKCNNPTFQIIKKIFEVSISNPILLDEVDFSSIYAGYFGQIDKEMNKASAIYDLVRRLPNSSEAALIVKSQFAKYSTLHISISGYHDLKLNSMKKICSSLRFSLTVSEFLEIIRKLKGQNQFDRSDFLILVMGFLKQTLDDLTANEKAKALFIELQRDYVDLEYEKCKILIETLNILLELNLTPVISEWDAIPEPNPSKNYSRRYFETSLSQFEIARIFGCHSFDLQENEVTHLIKDFALLILDMRVNTAQEALFALESMTLTVRKMEWNASSEDRLVVADILTKSFYWEGGKVPDRNTIIDGTQKLTVQQRSFCLEILSDTFQKLRDRNNRKDTDQPLGKQEFKRLATEIEEKKLGPSAYTRARGEIKSFQPLPFDEISKFDIRNPYVEINTYTKGLSGEAFYPQTHKRSPFICSISGHSFWMCAVIEKYMLANQADPCLSKKVNQLLMTAISAYTRKGWHSIHEMKNATQEPASKELYKKYGVDINPLSMIAENSITAALNITAHYTLKLVRQNVLNKDFL